ncbi:hypothetical protein [Chitinibacter sp. S2-10]|uniref:hypothetical protein n=1 Tax=Chitinibacter sp. S2-10 TaxID=3373597 RepID=UPI0039776546
MSSLKKQNGVATLLTAMVALFIMTISVFLVNRVTLIDMLNSSAQTQSSRAKEAAEAGINYALAQLDNNGTRAQYFCGNYIRSNTTACATPSSANAGNAFVIAETALSTSGMAFTTTITRSDPSGPIRIRSIGGKQGCLSGITCTKSVIDVLLSTDPLFGRMPPDAVSSPGYIGITGSICAQNASGNGGFAARAGMGLDTTNNLQGTGCAASNANGLYGAIGTTDKNLAAMNGTLQNKFTTDTGYSADLESSFFKYTFDKNESYIYQNANERLGGAHATSSQSLNTFANSGSDCSKTCGKVIWVSEQGLFDLGNGTYGSTDAPVIIILNGAATITGSPVINGMLYVSGSLTVTGTPNINGAVSVGGAVSGNGTLTVLYTADSKENSEQIPAGFTMQSGSWRDW